MKFKYVNTFVLPLPKTSKANYRKISKVIAKAWIKHGAIDYFECEGDQMDEGPTTSFPKTLKLKPNETVIMGFGLFKSKADCKRALKNISKDPSVAKYMNPENMLFDPSRMYWGGFKRMG